MNNSNISARLSYMRRDFDTNLFGLRKLLYVCIGLSAGTLLLAASFFAGLWGI